MSFSYILDNHLEYGSKWFQKGITLNYLGYKTVFLPNLTKQQRISSDIAEVALIPIFLKFVNIRLPLSWALVTQKRL